MQFSCVQLLAASLGLPSEFLLCEATMGHGKRTFALPLNLLRPLCIACILLPLQQPNALG